MREGGKISRQAVLVATFKTHHESSADPVISEPLSRTQLSVNKRLRRTLTNRESIDSPRNHGVTAGTAVPQDQARPLRPAGTQARLSHRSEWVGTHHDQGSGISLSQKQLSGGLVPIARSIREGRKRLRCSNRRLRYFLFHDGETQPDPT